MGEEDPGHPPLGQPPDQQPPDEELLTQKQRERLGTLKLAGKAYQGWDDRQRDKHLAQEEAARAARDLRAKPQGTTVIRDYRGSAASINANFSGTPQGWRRRVTRLSARR
jgi:hypothetical protein